MLFGLTSPEKILSKMGRNSVRRTLKTEYVDTYGTCGIRGATMRTRHELPAFIFVWKWIRGNTGYGIEVKAGSDKCLAKSVAVT